MVSVLVVDDSADDLRLIVSLLEADAKLDVTSAEHGVEALEKMKGSAFDLVVTELAMPELDGLGLVQVASREYPLVPVIIVTAQGNEEIAVRALEQGAASYVPKRVLADRLLETVRKVLTLSHRKRRQTQLMESLSENKCAFVLENDPDLFDVLATHLQEEATRMGLFSEAECTRLGVALEEALNNALYHGNLEVGRQRDREARDALVARRREEPPYRDRRIRVEVEFLRDRAVFLVEDDGAGFDHSALPNLAVPASLAGMERRGVFLMQALMDEVVYSETGSAVTLIKCCRTGSDLTKSEDF
ncbi:MAG: response regulator [Planctomycetes bacterium]|nr:response regulator [Planctomycetota bacterium]